MRLGSVQSNLGERAGEFMLGSWSDARTRVESNRPRTVNVGSMFSANFFWSAILRGRRSILDGECCCSAHAKWRFICDGDQSCVWLYVPGAIFSAVAGWLSCGRRTIWWRWKVLAVAPLIANDVSYVSRINHESHISGQAQYLVTLESHFSRQAQNLVMSECSSWWQAQE